MFDYKIHFSWIGLVVFMIPMVINIFYVIFPPANVQEETPICNKIWEYIEQGSRILYAVCMCGLVSIKAVSVKSPLFFLALVFITLYYIVWIRYFAGGRDVALLGRSFLFVPMPLAVFPVLYFLFAALWMHNYIAAVVMVIFGIAHNVVSYASLKG